MGTLTTRPSDKATVSASSFNSTPTTMGLFRIVEIVIPNFQQTALVLRRKSLNFAQLYPRKAPIPKRVAQERARTSLPLHRARRVCGLVHDDLQRKKEPIWANANTRRHVNSLPHADWSRRELCGHSARNLVIPLSTCGGPGSLTHRTQSEAHENRC